MKRALLVLAFLLAVGVSRPVAAAPLIEFETTDVGGGLWQYRYYVSGIVFDVDQGFAIDFDHALYADLEDPPLSPNGDWDPITFQPDVALASPGVYDALALTNSASLADPFAVSFRWLGQGTPGSQPFVIYQLILDPNGTDLLFTELASGRTTARGITPIPEPSTLLLMSIGVGGMIGRRLRRRKETP